MIINSNELVNQSRQNIREKSVESVQQLLPAQICIIDVREPGEFRQGRIDGSVNMPRGLLEMQLSQHPSVAGLENPLEQLANQDIYLICRSGGRSALAAESLQRMGFEKVYSIAGGMTAWETAGFTVEK